jgi:hypothetical protein
MSDRARQALWNTSLMPVVEATSDPQSYGDLIEAVGLLISKFAHFWIKTKAPNGF